MPKCAKKRMVEACHFAPAAPANVGCFKNISPCPNIWTWSRDGSDPRTPGFYWRLDGSPSILNDTNRKQFIWTVSTYLEKNPWFLSSSNIKQERATNMLFKLQFQKATQKLLEHLFIWSTLKPRKQPQHFSPPNPWHRLVGDLEKSHITSFHWS